MAFQDAFVRYLPVVESAISCGACVTGAGHVSIRPGEDYPPAGLQVSQRFDWHRGSTLPDYQLVLITDGAGEFESEATGRIKIEGSALVFLFPEVWHRYRPAAHAGWSERWIAFNGDLVKRLFEGGRFGPRLAVSRPRDAERLATDFDELLDDIDRRAPQHPAVLIFKALRLTSTAVAERVEKGVTSGGTMASVPGWRAIDDSIVQRALELIWTHGDRPLSVSDVARQLPVTRRTLDRRFAEATGHSVLEEINMCRLSRAKRLLIETDLPVKTIAKQAGYSSTERMRVAFVECEGASPTFFRKRIAEQCCRDSHGRDSKRIAEAIRQPSSIDLDANPLS